MHSVHSRISVYWPPGTCPPDSYHSLFLHSSVENPHRSALSFRLPVARSILLGVLGAFISLSDPLGAGCSRRGRSHAALSVHVLEPSVVVILLVRASILFWVDAEPTRIAWQRWQAQEVPVGVRRERTLRGRSVGGDTGRRGTSTRLLVGVPGPVRANPFRSPQYPLSCPCPFHSPCRSHSLSPF